MSEPTWLSRADVEILHAIAIETAGGAPGLRDADLLESAIARPRNLHAYGENDRFQLAASYAEALARNHAFVDGNKRTAFQAADVFLFQNGHTLQPRNDDGYVDMMEELAQGRVSREQMADYLRSNERTQERETASQDQAKDWTAKPEPSREIKPLPPRNRDREQER